MIGPMKRKESRKPLTSKRFMENKKKKARSCSQKTKYRPVGHEEISEDEIRQALLQNLAEGNSSLKEENPASQKQRVTDSSDCGVSGKQAQSDGSLSKKKSWELELEEELRSFQNKQESSSLQSVKVNASGGSMKEPEVVIFESHVKRKKKLTELTSKEQDSSILGKGKMKMLSDEIYHFGLSGMSFEDREKYEMQRAVRLGAKPPKNAHINYKEYMEQLRNQRKRQKEQNDMDRQMGFNVAKKSRGSAHSGLLRNVGFWKDPTTGRGFRVDGQLGKYKRGVQVLSKDDVEKITKKKKTKSKTTKINL